jgi:hypothetical protein
VLTHMAMESFYVLLKIVYEKEIKEINIVFLQPGLEESFFNSLRGKQIDYSHVYFKKSHDSLKISCD